MIRIFDQGKLYLPNMLSFFFFFHGGCQLHRSLCVDRVVLGNGMRMKNWARLNFSKGS